MSARHMNGNSPAGWTCRPCNSPLTLHPVVLAGDGGDISVELPCCPKCGKVFVSPDFAAKGMPAAEQRFSAVKQGLSI